MSSSRWATCSCRWTLPALAEMMEKHAPAMGTGGGRLAMPMLALPLSAQDRLIGAMLVGQKDGLPFPKRRVELLAGLANQAALVIDMVNANMAQQEESMGDGGFVAGGASVDRKCRPGFDRLYRGAPDPRYWWGWNLARCLCEKATTPLCVPHKLMACRMMPRFVSAMMSSPWPPGETGSWNSSARSIYRP